MFSLEKNYRREHEMVVEGLIGREEVLMRRFEEDRDEFKEELERRELENGRLREQMEEMREGMEEMRERMEEELKVMEGEKERMKERMEGEKERMKERMEGEKERMKERMEEELEGRELEKERLRERMEEELEGRELENERLRERMEEMEERMEEELGGRELEKERMEGRLKVMEGENERLRGRMEEELRLKEQEYGEELERRELEKERLELENGRLREGMEGGLRSGRGYGSEDGGSVRLEGVDMGEGEGLEEVGDIQRILELEEGWVMEKGLLRGGEGGDRGGVEELKRVQSISYLGDLGSSIEGLKEILESIKHNKITGFLVRYGNILFQWIEGEKDKVESLYFEKMSQGQKDHQLICLENRDLGFYGKRVFPGWSMKVFDFNQGSHEPTINIFRVMIKALAESEFTLLKYTQPWIDQFLFKGVNGLEFSLKELSLKWEEKVVVVTDLLGLTVLLEKLDPKVVLLTINHVIQIVSKHVKENGGQVIQGLGYGLLAVFSKDDVDRAIQSSIGICEDLDMKRGWGNHLVEHEMVCISIGIACGEVFFGNVGIGSRWNCALFGNPVKLALNLEKLTRKVGGRVLLSKKVKEWSQKEWDFRGIGDFELIQGNSESVYTLESISGIEIEGIDQRVKNYEVIEDKKELEEESFGSNFEIGDESIEIIKEETGEETGEGIDEEVSDGWDKWDKEEVIQDQKENRELILPDLDIPKYYEMLIPKSLLSHIEGLNPDRYFDGRGKFVSLIEVGIDSAESLFSKLKVADYMKLYNKVLNKILGDIYGQEGLVYNYSGENISLIFGLLDFDETKEERMEVAKKSRIVVQTIQSKITVINEYLEVKGLPAIHLSIGVHSGVVGIGKTGFLKESPLLVLGDGVRVVRWLNFLSRQNNFSVMYSEGFYNLLKEEDLKVFRKVKIPYLEGEIEVYNS